MALRVKTFRLNDDASEQALNDFLQNKMVRHWSAEYSGDPALGHWNVLIAYELQERRNNNNDSRREARSSDRHQVEERPKKERKEPEHVVNLSPEEMPLFEAIRKWRNVRAKEAKVKPFTLFNNKQLESLVKEKPATSEALRALIPNMADDVFDRYHNEILGFIAGSRELEHAEAASSAEAVA